jgi:phosphatidylserine decarboxylase
MIVLSNLLIGVLLAVVLLIPLVVKWELDKAVSLPPVLVIGCFAGVITGPLVSAGSLPLWASVCVQGVLIVSLAAALLLWRFFRDPERSCGAVERSVLAAADGSVIYVKRFEQGQIPVSEKKGKSFSLDEFAETSILPPSGYLIGTAMTYLDVHVNRTPIDGQVRFLKQIAGKFFSLKRPEAVFLNERAVTVIDGPGLSIGIVQIASRLVRNIIPFVHKGDAVTQGQRIGKIRFGSQVDIILPDVPGLTIHVKPGDKMKAGISVLARY